MLQLRRRAFSVLFLTVPILVGMMQQCKPTKFTPSGNMKSALGSGWTMNGFLLKRGDVWMVCQVGGKCWEMRLAK